MKITKVDNVHSSVKTNEMRSSGILYKSPDAYKSKGNDFLDSLISERLKNSGYDRMYNIYFVSGKKNGSEKSADDYAWHLCIKAMGVVNITFKNIMKNVRISENKVKEIVDSIKKGQLKNTESVFSEIGADTAKALGNLKKETVEFHFKDDIKTKNGEKTDISLLEEDLINICLGRIRKTMRKTVSVNGNKYELSDILTCIVLQVTQYLDGCYQKNEKNGKIKIYDVIKPRTTDDELETVISAVIFDRSMIGLHANLKKSIESQIVPTVACYNARINKKELKLAICSGKKSKPNDAGRKMLFELMTRDEYGYKEAFFRIKKDIVAFFMGEDCNEIRRIVDDGQNSDNLWDIIRYLSECQNELFISELPEEIKNKSAASKVRLQIREKCAGIVSGLYNDCREDESRYIDIFVYFYIEEYIEKLFSKNARLTKNYLKVGHLIKGAWQNIRQYICSKFIDMGKGVYYFAIPKERIDFEGRNEARLGDLRDEYQSNVTSFDYEYIKAEESLLRDISKAVTFAGGNFQASAFRDGYDDTLGRKRLKRFDYGALSEHSKRDVLRFFGGMSTRNGIICSEDDYKEFVTELHELLSGMRMESFHFISEKADTHECRFVQSFICDDIDGYSGHIRKKYYSNNAYMYYYNDTAVENFTKMLNNLYKSDTVRPAQIPSFRNVLSRKKEDLLAFLYNLDFKEQDKCLSDDQFLSCIYFILKEIYYKGFVANETAAKTENRFFEKAYNKVINDAINIRIPQKNGKKDRNSPEFKQSEAAGQLKKVVEGVDKKDAGSFCQFLLTFENQQNSGVSDESSKKYKFIKPLLKQIMQRAFLDYIKKNENLYGFLSNPSEPSGNSMPEADYLPNLECGMYADLKDKIDGVSGAKLLEWYAVGKFLQPKELNLLIGSLKNYNAYISSVARRQKDAGISRDNSPEKINDDTLKMLDLCLNYSGMISGEVTDYYDDKNAFAKELSRFVNFSDSDDSDLFEKLKVFSKGSDNLYVDEENCKLIRSIELSRMYSSTDILAQCMTKVEREEIDKYIGNIDKVSSLASDIGEKTEEEQRQIIEYQQLKNRIELHDVQQLSEIMNDMLGELISALYLRERDYMFFHLGYHYMIRQAKERASRDGTEYGAYSYSYTYYDRRRRAEITETKIINMRQNDLALYNCLAQATFNYDVIIPSERPEGKGGSNGLKMKIFKDIYNSGYANMLESDFNSFMATRTRNYIDHFSYKADTGYEEVDGEMYPKAWDRSLNALYGDVFAYTFKYNEKLHKLIPVLYKNVLEKYHLNAKMRVSTVREFNYMLYYEGDGISASRNLSGTVKAPLFTVEMSSGTGEHWIKTKNGQKAKKKFNLKSEKFCKEVQDLLEYCRTEEFLYEKRNYQDYRADDKMMGKKYENY